MIRNENDYNQALRLFKQDGEVTAKQREGLVAAGLTPEEVATAMEPLLTFQEQLTEEITWYENVLRQSFSPARRLTDLGRLLIASRIAIGLNQKELAKLLGVSEAQVSRDERNEYHGITLERAQHILDVLQATVTTTLDSVPSRRAGSPSRRRKDPERKVTAP
jgi:DNA-directed RNA polymerase specialized sigma subunit